MASAAKGRRQIAEEVGDLRIRRARQDLEDKNLTENLYLYQQEKYRMQETKGTTPSTPGTTPAADTTGTNK